MKATERLDDQTIAGRSASCYSFDSPEYLLAMFCVDPSQGIPLLFHAEHPKDYRLSQAMEAISISTAAQDLVIPSDLEPDPVEGFPDFEDTVPLSDLLLPDLPELVE